MFRPNKSCIIHAATGRTDVYGMPLPSVRYTERCSVVEMNIRSEKSAVRADTSATRGNAREMATNTIILLAKNTVARINDNVEVNGHQFQIVSLFPRYDTMGSLDHVQVGCAYWTGA